MNGLISSYSAYTSKAISGGGFFPPQADKSFFEPTSSPQDSQQFTDKISLSPEAKELANTLGSTDPQRAVEATNKPEDPGFYKQPPGSVANDPPLDQTQQQEVAQLKARDNEVRQHERAHLSAAGQFAAGGASFSYQNGPDGRKYAVGGEVPIDIGKESTPEATIQKMQTVKRAALAPASPSSTDRMVAAQADAKASQARSELQEQQLKEMTNILASANTPPQPSSSFIAIPENESSANTTPTIEGPSRRSLMINTYSKIGALS